jgi:hypothetical protein
MQLLFGLTSCLFLCLTVMAQSGSITDFTLTDALTALLNGTKRTIVERKPIGCMLQRD